MVKNNEKQKAKAYPIPTTDAFVRVTPAKAAYWLEHYNNKNRGMRPRYTQGLARDMTNGSWEVNDIEPISFGKDGNLIEGQHRLAAVVAARCPIRFMCLVNRNPVLRQVIDQGRSRSAADVLRMRGVPHASRVAAIVRYILILSYGNPWAWSRHSITNAEIATFVQEHPEVFDCLNMVPNSLEVTLYRTSRVPVACCYYFRQVDEEATIRFFTGLAAGIGVSTYDPLVALRRYLLRLQQMKYGTNELQARRTLVTYKTFNLFLQGKDVKQLKVSDRERLPLLPGQTELSLGERIHPKFRKGKRDLFED